MSWAWRRFATADVPGWADAMLAPMLAFVAYADRVGGREPMLGSRPGLAGYFERARDHAIVRRSIDELEAHFPATTARDA